MTEKTTNNTTSQARVFIHPDGGTNDSRYEVANNTVVQEICPTKLSDNRQKKYQKKTWGIIINAINGLFNSCGGTLILRYNRDVPDGQVRNCMRILEQKIQDFLGVITLSFDIDAIKIIPSTPHGHGEIKIIVKTSTKAEHMIALKLNIYLPSSQQVMEILKSESVENLRALLMENLPSVESTESCSHHRNFVKDEFVPFPESKKTQFKMMKDEPAKRTTFADRLVGEGNKFACYVSAFANYAGGHMYIGINDDGKVEGEFLNENEKNKVKKEIRKAINKMEWPKKSEPTDTKVDQRWDVYFEPIRDGKNNVIPSLYVVVVFVAQCRGGVFTEGPECYEIVDNTVQKVDFASWKKSIDPRLTEEGTQCADAPPELVYEALTNLLNNNCNGDELNAASKTAQENYTVSDVKLTCLSNGVSFHLRKGQHDKAEEILKEYSETLPSSTDPTRAKVTEQYLHSIMERCKRNYHKSYEIAKKCLNDLTQLPFSNRSAAFYVQIATLENILAMKTENRKEMLSLLRKAKRNYDTASQHLDQLQGHSNTKAEYQQKIYINKALLYLGCSLSGDMLADCEELINIEKAQHYLCQTQHIIIRLGYPLRKFRTIQYLFAQACLSYRMGNDDSSRRTELLKHALDYSKEAESLAKNYGFPEMKTYAEKFIKFFESKKAK